MQRFRELICVSLSPTVWHLCVGYPELGLHSMCMTSHVGLLWGNVSYGNVYGWQAVSIATVPLKQYPSQRSSHPQGS